MSTRTMGVADPDDLNSESARGPRGDTGKDECTTVGRVLP
jgi:hypothetical protein